MIYDGHAYCVPDLNGDGGFADPTEFRRHVRLAGAGMGHTRPLWRARDREPVDTSAMADLSKGWTFDSLKEADFRLPGFGRVEWSADGEDYVKQLMPPSVADMSYSAEQLVAEMDYAGVDMAMLHRTVYLGIGNDFIAAAVGRYPGRLQGLAHVEEWLVESDPDASIAKLDRAVNEQGLSGLQFLPMFMRLYGRNDAWDGPGFRPFWDAVAAIGIPVFFTLSPRGEPTPESYMEALRALRGWMDDYPDVAVISTHGFNWRMFRDGDAMVLPHGLFESAPAENPNFHMQLVLAVTLGARWEYPMLQFQPALEKLCERIGPEKLIWGSDMPFNMNHYTYHQTLDHLRNYSPNVSDADMDLIVGGNMARIMGVA